MTPPDRIAEIRAAIAAMTFDRFGHEDAWSVDPHGDGWALMLGSGRGMHGLNMVHITEPSYQWPVVGRYMLAAMNGAPALLAALDDRDREIERLREDVTKLRAETWALGTARDEALDERDAAFRAGAEAMREACAIEAEQHDAEAEPFIKGGVLRILARDIRALPVPEAKR